MMDKISKREIEIILNEHELWLSGDVINGKQANFSEKMISITNFKRAKLSKSKFTKAVLKTIEFVNADLHDADFGYSQLTKIDFHDADLIGSNFKGAVFQKVHMNEDMYEQMMDTLTENQKNGIITSYKKFMRKMIF
jgi:uncharacterized protein YjbI with pentapeptide repeats